MAAEGGEILFAQFSVRRIWEKTGSKRHEDTVWRNTVCAGCVWVHVAYRSTYRSLSTRQVTGSDKSETE